MPTASDLEMIDLDDLSNPITIRFNVGTAWGRTTQELTVDAPGVPNDLEVLTRFTGLLWATALAIASNAAAELIFTETVIWKAGPAAIALFPGAFRGAVHGAIGPKAEAGVLTLHTGHNDKYARRWIYFSDFTASWRDDRVLTSAGLTGMYRAAAAMAMGLGLDVFGGPMAWLIPYARVLPFTPSNILGVAFRRVKVVRVQSYCEPPPEGSNLDWP